ncbi:quinone-interacting membrane-bound oxidoreductase complex subunit QmoC [Paucidesulfovibrio longus]|uniref:quinone-interacting membrane-bound oxidoreductase complex subunit QmoC n=1 Tax=Paucidesulfovibrio longus TaxID=889 RepID=UPI0003B61974|nr:quinone-interacting membrane-bound oxidoreductase complex subunit QmoC [Paucidesulfovibrio longus]
MSNPVKVQPDLKFVKELQAVGGESLKKCYQCATCSVVCPLSPQDDPYPRKEMVWAQWGLKDKLVNDIDIWLCHNCGTCSDLCPRGAKPGDLLGALRNMAYRSLAAPQIIGKWMSSSKFLPLLVAIPAVLWMLIWVIRAGQLGTAFPLFELAGHGWEVSENGVIAYGGLFPGDFTIDPIFVLTFFTMVGIFVGGVRKLLASFADLPKVYVLGQKETPGFLCALIDTLKYEVLQNSQLNECGAEPKDQQRFKGHLLLMYSFVALAIVTGVVAVTHWGGYFLSWIGAPEGLTDFVSMVGHTPMNLVNPVKLLANVGFFAGLLGLIWLTGRRVSLDKAKQGSSWYDWYLLTIIWVVFLTGFGAEVLRLTGQKFIAYPTYYVHLVAVWMLFAYLPWSKLGHLVYRTVALAYAKKIGRIPMGPRV